MLNNPQDKPILSDRSQTQHRDRLEAKFAQIFGTRLIARGRAVDLDNLAFALSNAIATQIWMLWQQGMSLGNGDASWELMLIGWKKGRKRQKIQGRGQKLGGGKGSPLSSTLLPSAFALLPSKANFAIQLENLPARQAIFDRINLLSGSVAESEFDRIRDALGENIKGDISRQQLVAAISEVLGSDRFTARARTIARTELTAAYNTGRVQTYRENSIEAVRRYCIRDERTCPTCAGLNGMVARLDSADLSRLQPPSHPNCRCTLSPVVNMRQLIEAGRKLRNDVNSSWEIEAIANS